MLNKIGALGSKCRVVVSLKRSSVESATVIKILLKEDLHCLCGDVCVGRTVEVWQRTISKEFGSGNTAACRTFCSC